METKGYIYIMTNPAFNDMVKIGYASDVERRRKELSTTNVPLDYEVYATYETPKELSDKELHKLLDTLDPDLRINKKREFFSLSKEGAYDLLRAIARISGTEDRLKLYNEEDYEEVVEEEIKIESPTFFTKNGRGANGIGKLKENSRFIVFKGSRISNTIVESSKGDYCDRTREKLIENGTIVDNIFTVDYVFNSPSGASATILGNASNGYDDWKDKEGKKLGTYRKNQELLWVKKKGNWDKLPEIVYTLDYHLRKNVRGAEGSGILHKDNTFTVKEGAKISDEISDAFYKVSNGNCIKERNRLIEEGIIVDNKFVKDYTFSSSSFASCLMLGKDASGYWHWVDENDRPISDYRGE